MKLKEMLQSKPRIVNLLDSFMLQENMTENITCIWMTKFTEETKVLFKRRKSIMHARSS